MKRLLLFLGMSCLATPLFSQNVYTIKADSVKITNCDSAELILENHTQSIPGFLYNTGHGRTVFKRGVIKINDSVFLIGADTLTIPKINPWLQGGNAFGTTGKFGTLDNNPIDFYTNNVQRGRWTNGGNFLIGTTSDAGYKLNVNGPTNINGDINQIAPHTSQFGNKILLDQVSNSSRIFSPTMIIYQSNNTGNQHFFNNAIGASFVGDLVTIDPGQGALQNSQLSLNVKGRQGNLGLCVNMSGSVGIGTTSPTAQLHTTASVRFAGLTQDSTQTRVLVSDANGNLYYRSASSLAFNGMLNSSLAVNGTISARKLKLDQTG